MRARRDRCVWWWSTRKFALLKRLVDVLCAGVALVLLAPLFALVALAIKLQDGGAVLFWQDRVGLNAKVFRFPKFRSMRVHAPSARAALEQQNQHGAQGITFKLKHDPRITWVGRWLRRTSIDELPQLWCVFRGTMSLVGPRPPLPSEVCRYTQQERQRLSVVPGLTCIWQVSGRSEVPFPEQVRMDIDYIQHRSIAADVKLLAKTLPAVVRGRGAY